MPNLLSYDEWLLSIESKGVVITLDEVELEEAYNDYVISYNDYVATII